MVEVEVVLGGVGLVRLGLVAVGGHGGLGMVLVPAAAFSRVCVERLGVAFAVEIKKPETQQR